MATAHRREVPAVAEELRREPYRFAFFQAVRLFRLRHEVAGRRSDALRFEVPLSLQFPASEIDGLTTGEGQEPDRLRVNFIGLTGPSGVLPRHYTARLIEQRIRHRDQSGQRFFDIFHHRIVSLFYRAWEKHHFEVAYERGERGGLTRYLMDLIGLGTAGLHGRAAAGPVDEHLGYVAGLITQQPRSAATVAASLAELFDAPVRVESFRGRWLVLGGADLARLGRQNTRLGDDLLLGDRVWDHQSSCRIRIGPVRLQQFVRLLPGGVDHRPLIAAARFLLGLALEVKIQIVLDRAEAPRLVLGGREPRRLGLDTWLRTKREPTTDPDDVVFPVGLKEAA